ncbi:MAG TPA: YkvA family protein [Longimicrobiaceae bacterium]|nr:YkvA family protein [Longimicrobiaceae bacterium]
MAEHSGRPYRLHDDEDDALEDEVPVRRAIQAPRLRRGPRAAEPEEREAGGGGARETVMSIIRDVPNFIKLLARLARDPRVSTVDKAIVVATLGYVLMPLDLIPDVIPFLGQVDDVYLVMLALERLMGNAGMDVLLDHWDGEVSGLERALSGLEKASAFLPEPIRRFLHRRVG